MVGRIFFRVACLACWLASGISEILIFFHEWIWLCSDYFLGIIILRVMGNHCIALSSGRLNYSIPSLPNKILFVSKMKANRVACNGLPQLASCHLVPPLITIMHTMLKIILIHMLIFMQLRWEFGWLIWVFYE